MDLQSMGEFNCDVCFELFGEDIRCPRILACGHSFCHSCLENLLVQSPSCPNCKKEIQFTSVDGIPVNYTVKSIVSRLKIPESFKEQNTPLNNAHSKLSMELKKDSLDSLPLKKELLSSKELPYEGYCEDHQTNKHFRCMDCKCWVCGICATLNHKSCLTVLVAEALKGMKQEVSREVEAEIEGQKLQRKIFDNVLVDLEKKRLSIKNEIKILQLNLRKKIITLKSIGEDIENLQSRKSDSKKHCEKLKLMKNSVEETSNGGQFIKAKNKLNTFLIEAKKWIEELTIPRYSRSHFSLELLRDWCQDGSVYASRCQNGPTQYGKVVVKGDRVWVHCFKPQRPPQQNVIISVDDGTSVLSDVVIATDALTPRAMNFSLICSGIKGRSYEGDKFYPIEKWILTPPHEEGAVVRGIKDGNVYKAPWKKGFVCGYEAKHTNLLSRFAILMQDEPSVKLDTKFGFVEEGIDVCEIIYNNNKQTFSIKHCGLVI